MINALISIEIMTSEGTDIHLPYIIMELGAAVMVAAGCLGTSSWSSATPGEIPKVQCVQ